MVVKWVEKVEKRLYITVERDFVFSSWEKIAEEVKGNGVHEDSTEYLSGLGGNWPGNSRRCCFVICEDGNRFVENIMVENSGRFCDDGEI